MMKDTILKKIMNENYKSSLPILGRTCVKNGFATRTDLDVEIRFRSPFADGVYEWCVNPRKLEDEVNEFPETTLMENPLTFSMAGETLLKALKRVAPAQSKDELRYVLTSVYMVKEGHYLTLTATDGKRLHTVTVTASGGENASAIIPSVAVARILKYGGGDFVSVSVDDKYVRFNFGEIVLTARKIDTTYPNYKQVIPATHNVSITTDAKAFAEALKASEPAAKAAYKALQTKLDDPSIYLYMLNISIFILGHIKSNIKEIDLMRFPVAACVNKWEGQTKIDASFSHKYLTDAVAACDGETTLMMDDELNPMVITSGEFLAVIMPIRTS